MEKIFENMVSDFKKEVAKDYAEERITEAAFNEINFTIDNMITIYYKDLGALEAMRVLDGFITAYIIMK
jgi:hypothetical protein